MYKSKKRKIIIITGSDSSGKSKLGQMLGVNKNFLYSYVSISHHDYFDSKTFRIHNEKISSLRKDI